MNGWDAVIGAWSASLDDMDAAFEAGDWGAAAAAVWTPPAQGPTDLPDPTQRLQLIELNRRAGRAARRITEAMAAIGDQLADAARRRGAARVHHTRPG